MYKAIAADLDGTLTKSKSLMESDMGEALSLWLNERPFAIISGAEFMQMKKQIIRKLPHETKLENLYFFPTNGATCFTYQNNDWIQVYKDEINHSDEEKITQALKRALMDSKVEIARIYGEQIQNRGGQITLSALGQNAPFHEKSLWDPNQEKRKSIVSHLTPFIEEFSIGIAGTTSIDITKKNIDKAYALFKMKEILKLDTSDILFLGDALFEGGNDFAAKKSGVMCLRVNGPQDSLKIIQAEYQNIIRK